ncbi:uncharacterized protein LOC115879926 isoform X2 [Sitophilus oryzae]|uniref:Uncharacterized protein LOC115879926 isoform X2 n=1 Tax=Sitophilus oryzae TaxID=7048 RepID=A0A6J2XQA9_SITOR|nr:uncharacterized protein LOC115879926 isoform X2 [Sitophilus oryzae]
MNKFIVGLIVIFLLFSHSLAVFYCFNRPCPANTQDCDRDFEILNLTAAEIRIHCLNDAVHHTITCFERECPDSTSSCKKQSKSTIDRKRIDHKISCLDKLGASLKEYYFEEPSTLDKHTFFQSTSYGTVKLINNLEK